MKEASKQRSNVFNSIFIILASLILVMGLSSCYSAPKPEDYTGQEAIDYFTDIQEVKEFQENAGELSQEIISYSDPEKIETTNVTDQIQAQAKLELLVENLDEVEIYPKACKGMLEQLKNSGKAVVAACDLYCSARTSYTVGLIDEYINKVTEGSEQMDLASFYLDLYSDELSKVQDDE